ncbi:hypothetical protein MNBD_ALPHA09-1025 [hydrothermal vent metagenome]|uniref:Metallo-beta-lactamase domain-containing protein n=1 Tax=hydrothermal vent metagenome TaxID=652676 RepID=A0A3B0TV65_9ZZZZ
MAELQLTFWGTRGSLPCSGTQYLRYGGNTCCVELRHDGHTLIFDAGSGIRGLGERLAHDSAGQIDLMLSHYHFDHICGLPFFAPFFHSGNDVRLWAGQSAEWPNVSDMLDGFMKPPFFPITPSAFRAHLGFHNFLAGDELTLAWGAQVRTAPLIHPQGATGYRVEIADKSICYVTDTEMAKDGKPTKAMIDLVMGADLLILDTMFTDAELNSCQGWGHSSWRQGIDLADAADVKTLYLFHHHPLHDDTAMDRIAADAAETRPGTMVAREGETIIL